MFFLLAFYYCPIMSMSSPSQLSVAEGVKRRARGQGSSREKRSRTSSSVEESYRPPSAASVFGQDPDPGSGSPGRGSLFFRAPPGLTSAELSQMSVPASQVPSLAFSLAAGSGETTFSSAVPRLSSGFLTEGSGGVGTADASPQPVQVAENAPAVSAPQVSPPQANPDPAFRKEMDEFKQMMVRMNQSLLRQVLAHQSLLRQELAHTSQSSAANSSRAPAREQPRAARTPGPSPTLGSLLGGPPLGGPSPFASRDSRAPRYDYYHDDESFPQSDFSEPDSERYDEGDQASEGSFESDASEQRFPTSNSDDPGTAEIQAVLGVLRDSLGLPVAPPVEQPSGFFTSSHSVSRPSLSVPVASEIKARADHLASFSELQDKPHGAHIPVSEDANAVLTSTQPIPDDAWDRLIAFKKAKVSSSSTAFIRKCRLMDVEQDRAHKDLLRFNSCASYGVSASMLLMYVVEWFNREEQGLLLQQPSSSVRSLMLGMLAKLSRRCMDQFLKVSFHATRLRRARVLPLLGLPEIARQRFRALSPVGSDLFGGAFQATVSNEAERVKALKETTIPSLTHLSGRTNPFRGAPSRQSGDRREGRPSGAKGRSGGGQQRRRGGRTGSAPSATAPASGPSFFQRQGRGGARRGSKSRRGGKGKA